MAKTLVLAEKPSVGRELARVLGCRQARDGCIAGPQYIVTWALGHLVELADPEHYGEKYKKWELDTLPMLPEKMDLTVIKESSKQFYTVQKLLRSPEIDKLVIATDAGREGELVARWIMKKAGYRGPVFRLWISSQTDRAIREGFQNLRPGREYENLYQSARCRAEADWYVGLNVTRALTCKYNAQLSAGRVQTPTLAMIVAREEEIRKFVPKDYYYITASAGGFRLTWRDKKNRQIRLMDAERARQIMDKCKGAGARLVRVKKEYKREAPPLLYDLTELQRDANRRFGFSAKQTLNIMQRLYENYKLLTYPRTDSRYLTHDVVPTLRERLRSVAVGPYAAPAGQVLQNGVRATKRVVDDSKVTDHHAIIPTEEPVYLERLMADERRIYDLVVKRFLAALSPDYEYDETTVSADIKGEEFYAKGKMMRAKGWKAVYEGIGFVEDDEEDAPAEEREQTLPQVREGQLLEVSGLKLGSGKTAPPKRYTEATLLSAMEHPGKFIESSELRSVVDQAGGIGTPATRADIIEKLFLTSYVERRGKEIFPLSKGMQLIELVPEDLKSPELTARWEQRLSAISRGREQSAAFVGEIKQYASKLVRDVVAADGSYRHDNMTRERCPVCDKFLLEVNGKRGKMLVCQDRECGYRQSLSYLSNARCPTCHKKLEVFGEGEKKVYICKCGFREKFDKYNERLKENRNNMSKHEVARYMQKQKQEAEAETSAFAAAWAKAMGQDSGQK